MMGSRKAIKIEPNRTALVIIDMQNYFLHPDLSPAASDGRAAVAPTVKMIDGFRKHGMKVLWVNWGLTEYDLLTIPPAFKAGFSGGSYLANETFGSDMGTIKENGTTIEVGRLLMRGSWNAEPYGVLGTMKDEGIKAGTDLWFNKNRLSGLWGPQTPLGLWLQENEVSTLFFGGVNADQCVWSTLVDAYFKGKRPQCCQVTPKSDANRLLFRLRCGVCRRHLTDNKPLVCHKYDKIQCSGLWCVSSNEWQNQS
jgi:nicotinamidase-related amidase